MARRKARIPQGKKIQPAQLTISTSMNGNSVATLDISQCASLLNRRFYRQGLNWAVSGFTFLTEDPAQSGFIGVQKIPDTWVSSNSWEKGFRAWQKMNNDALDEAESVKPRFLDFKVFMDSVHHSVGEGANLLPYMGTPSSALTVGEWEYSKYVVPFGPASPGNTTDFDVIWTGANFPGAGATGADAVSLIEGYAASRGLPEILDPNAPADAADADGSTPENWLSALQNEGIDQDSEVLEDMITENNQAPYPFENAQVPGAAPGTVFTDTQYPGGANQPVGLGAVTDSKLAVHDIVGITATTIGGTTQMRGGNFQGGLIRFDMSALSESSNVAILIHLVPGPHRGYMCQAMQDV